jgi:hypothetical protein
MLGHTYDREAIERWMQKNDRSPVTHAKFTSKHLIPNLSLKRILRQMEHLKELFEDHFAWISDEVLFLIFEHLDSKTLGVIGRVTLIMDFWLQSNFA